MKKLIGNYGKDHIIIKDIHGNTFMTTAKCLREAKKKNKRRCQNV